MEAGLRVQLGPSHANPGTAEVTTDCGLLSSFKQVAHSQLQAEYDIDIHQHPSQEASGTTQPVASFRQH